ncbi:MAG: hypothetical protein E5299_00144 [Burkholderia gladioli]|nr:MAG: hypothetical protein E5299_00144 [Burkholderia gladioli]
MWLITSTRRRSRSPGSRCDARPETLAGERLEPIHCILGKRSPVVATVFLPFSTTVTGNCINRDVTPRHTGRIRWPMSGTLVWRNRKNSTACGYGRMAWLVS